MSKFFQHFVSSTNGLQLLFLTFKTLATHKDEDDDGDEVNYDDDDDDDDDDL